MNESTTKESLFKPGEANDFFQIANLPPFDPRQTTGYSRGNALWLAEFCRLIYRQDSRETPREPGFKTRDAILLDNQTGWREAETDFFTAAATQAALLINQSLGCAVLVFRGTAGLMDMLSDSMILAVRWPGRGHVHQGFKLALDAVWSQVEARLRSLRMPLVLTGHSLGAALATLAAARCRLDPQLDQPVALYTFGSPRVGDAAFGESLEGLFHCRVVDDEDLVTTVPPAFSVPLFPVYRHCGQLHRLLPDGRLLLNPQASSTPEPAGSPAAITDFVRTVRRLIDQARSSAGALPKALLDHAPVNYVARLERTAPPG